MILQMKDTAPSKRAIIPEVPAHTDAPPGWSKAQNTLAATDGLSLLLVEGHQPPSLAISNNNSICRAFQSSDAHAHLCDPYCGVAYERAQKSGTAEPYRCHAGLHCVAVPVEIQGRNLVVIGGRAFLKSADYRALGERIRSGDLQDLLSNDLFKNVIFAAPEDLQALASRVLNLVAEYNDIEHVEAASTAPETTEEIPPAAKESDAADTNVADTPDIVARQNLVIATSVSDLSLDNVCRAASKVLREKYELTSFALLIGDKAGLSTALAVGRFQKQPHHLEFTNKDALFVEAAREARSLPVYENERGRLSLHAANGAQIDDEAKTAFELFPLIVGHEAKDALLIGDAKLTNAKRRALIGFGQSLALPLEILRLRGELEKRERAADSLRDFTERVNTIEPAESYLSILQHSAGLLGAERGSLLMFDEASNELTIKASVGFHTEAAAEARVRLGDSVAGAVLETGRPLVVHDLQTAGYELAPAERRYKTKSFISYPISIAGRKVGVLNVTDKAGGGSYDDVDLSLLESIAPQMALALDRAEWREKAAQFELMAITDPLTGLLNRRYLEERLTEELKRSKRQGYAMSFMMIDIDDFKPYNDRNGHQEGDLALEMTAQCLKSALRGADVASRYGGEEFSILLPQTNLSEAKVIAERIRRRVERMRFPHGKAQPLGAVTVSIGLSAFDASLDTAASVIGAADRALYLAKSQGKNRVVSHKPQPGEPRASTSSKDKELRKDTDAAT